jgi:hypothetical protein
MRTRTSHRGLWPFGRTRAWILAVLAAWLALIGAVIYRLPPQKADNYRKVQVKRRSPVRPANRPYRLATKPSIADEVWDAASECFELPLEASAAYPRTVEWTGLETHENAGEAEALPVLLHDVFARPRLPFIGLQMSALGGGGFGSLGNSGGSLGLADLGGGDSWQQWVQEPTPTQAADRQVLQALTLEQPLGLTLSTEYPLMPSESWPQADLLMSFEIATPESISEALLSIPIAPKLAAFRSPSPGQTAGSLTPASAGAGRGSAAFTSDAGAGSGTGSVNDSDLDGDSADGGPSLLFDPANPTGDPSWTSAVAGETLDLNTDSGASGGESPTLLPGEIPALFGRNPSKPTAAINAAAPENSDIPEPSTMLMVLGGAALALAARKIR